MESLSIFVLLLSVAWVIGSPRLSEGNTILDKEYAYSEQLYNGMFAGKCDTNGFYYKDEDSFMMCSNGNAYEQHCAPGSKNSGYKNYAVGSGHYFHDFCDVNMVEYGYNTVEHKIATKKVPEPEGYEVNVEPKPEPERYEVKVQPKPDNTYIRSYRRETRTEYRYSEAYRGIYHGQCGSDGFYLNNDISFIICSNGNAYVQRCAAGSRNSGYNRYHYGDVYGYQDFCDVNLVDYGYGADNTHDLRYSGY